MIQEKHKQNLIIAVISASVFMFSVDYSMLNISLPNVARTFNVRISSISWVPLIYLLVMTSSLLGFGKLGDIKGYKKLFAAGAAARIRAGALSDHR